MLMSIVYFLIALLISQERKVSLLNHIIKTRGNGLSCSNCLLSTTQVAKVTIIVKTSIHRLDQL